MIAMINLLTVFIVIPLAWFLFSVIRMRFEGRQPVFYEDLSLADLNEHIFEMYQRGLKKCQLHIEEQNTGKKIVFRKNYKNSSYDIDFDLVAENICKGHKYPRDFLKNIRSQGVRCVYGIRKIPEIPPNNLVCRFGPHPELETIYKVTRIILEEGYCLSQETFFKVYVKGKIAWISSEFQLNGWTPVPFRRYPPMVNGKPYTKNQCRFCNDKANLAYRLGLTVGSITKLLFGWLRKK